MTFRLYSQQLPSQKMAENKLYDICVRGRCGIWLGFAILVIIVLATSLSKDGQATGKSDNQTAGIGQGGLVTDKPITDKPVTDKPVIDKPVTGTVYIKER